MRTFVGLTVLAVCVTLVYSETCTVDADCSSTQCSAGNNLICEHPDGDGVMQDGGLCTCATSSCMTREDCLSPNHPELNCEDSRRHCYDNTCICSRWPSGGIGK